ncbi:hypothetical protein VSS74_00970 [Conexibacter stalactiti]|uniref:Secreted protein n=1 Tax=Conexibacter stalactiti TaxID=1940611 RepID=A0ABU4HJN1_9ACTN|nr:hypothetical protein [Conexibacter stalactiti]MDW5592889.1 hypothetical protein [Conexibacter stalactiti]MEC5033530.1 hypothetical protein [Conexibacter stalactiti]
MSYRLITRARPWRGVVALVAACATLLTCVASSHAASTAFCPAGGGTMTLAFGVGCTNTDHTLLIRVKYYQPNAMYHCAVGKNGPQQDGSSGNAFAAWCGYGATGSGEVISPAPAGGTWGYARGKNEDTMGLTWSLFSGIKDH